MANPNRTAYLARHSSLVKTHEHHVIGGRLEADQYAEKLREQGMKYVRVTSFKLGPRNNPTRNFVVRAYEKRES